MACSLLLVPCVPRVNLTPMDGREAPSHESGGPKLEADVWHVPSSWSPAGTRVNLTPMDGREAPSHESGGPKLEADVWPLTHPPMPPGRWRQGFGITRTILTSCQTPSVHLSSSALQSQSVWPGRSRSANQASPECRPEVTAPTWPLNAPQQGPDVPVQVRMQMSDDPPPPFV